MNLVLSGPIDVTLRNLVVRLSTPRRVVPLHARADRLEGVDDTISVREQVAVLCDAARVDHAYIEEGVRFSDFKLLAMDMDSTLITIECIDEIADFAGKKAEVAAITEAAMRGEIDFGESLLRRVATFTGLHVDCLRRVYDERLVLSPGALELVQAAKRENLMTLLLSGGFTYFTARLVNQLSIDEGYANVLQCSAGILTGSVLEPIFDATAKADRVISTTRKLGCEKSQVIVIGDGANDIQMMKKVKFSVAYKAKATVQQQALLKVNYGPLTTVLDFFEYPSLYL